MSHSFSGSRVRVAIRLSTSAAAVAIGSGMLFVGGACDVYTSDLLTSAAGAAALLNGGRTSTVGSSSGGIGGATIPVSQVVGGSRGDGGSNSTIDSAYIGGTSGTGGTATISSPLGSSSGGSGGATTGAGFGGSVGTQAGGVAGGGAAGGGAAGGGAAGGGAAGGGATSKTCALDAMQDESGPIQGCDQSGEDFWYTFLPPGTGAEVGAINPLPQAVFARQLAESVGDESVVAEGAKYVATVSGQVPMANQAFGMGFWLNEYSPYSLRGATLDFWYRTRHSPSTDALRVTVPILATTFTGNHGTCTGNCGNHYGTILPDTGGKWHHRTLHLADKTSGGPLTQLPGWLQVDWNVDEALAIEFSLRDYSGEFEFSVGPIRLVWE